MTREKLASGDIALLERLSYGPCEVGDVPVDELERLTALGLAKRVLGCCEITRAGQLTFHRHQYTRRLHGRTFRVTGSDPALREQIAGSALQYRNQLLTFLNDRRKRDARSGGMPLMPERFKQLLLQTANKMRERGRAAFPSSRPTRAAPPNEKKPQRGSRTR